MTDIPITANERKAQFTGNTGLGPFAFVFNVLVESDIRVLKNNTVLTINTEYTVSLNVDGTGSVTLTDSGNGTALIAADILTIIGGRLLARTSDYVQGGNLFAGALNEDFDSIVIMMQQLDEKVSRTMRIDAGDVGENLLLPSKASRLNRVLQFNASTGDPEAGPTASDVANAQTNAANAAASASAAASSASAASGSASSASGSASAAASSASAASTSASNASTSASNASTSETNAAASASAASTSETNAASSASAASTSASNAATSETNAGNSASSAAGSASTASAAAASALAALDSFDDRYLGAKSSDPTVDNDGDPLVAGALYFNTVSEVMKLYTGSSWIAAYVSGEASSIAFTPTGDIAATNVQAAIAELDTEKVPRTGTTGAAVIPSGTEAQRPSPAAGQLRFNTEAGSFEGYDGAEWGAIGGGGGAVDDLFYENAQTVAANYNIGATRNAMTTGPISINSGVAVTVSSGARWVIL